MAGSKALRKVQLGLEGSSAGTIQAATNVLIGEGTLKDNREIVNQMGDVGAFLGNQNTRTAKLGGELAFEQECSFEQFPYVLNASIEAKAGVKDGAGSAYIYAYSAPTTAPLSPAPYTLEGGDNSGAEVMNYCYVPEWTLSGAGGEPLKLSSLWKGRTVAPQAFTAAIAVPTVEAVLFSRGQMWIDTSSDAIGTTVRSNTLLGMELKYNAGIKEVWTADGLTSPTFSFIKMTAPEIMLDITFEHDAISIAEKVLWRAETPQRIRLKFTGSTVTTTGTTYDNKVLIIDLYGKWISFDKLDEMDGNDIIKGTFKALYDSTGTSLCCDVTVVNELSALL